MSFSREELVNLQKHAVRLTWIIAAVILAVLLGLPILISEEPETCHDTSILSMIKLVVLGPTSVLALKVISPLLQQLARNRAGRSITLKNGRNEASIVGDICDASLALTLFKELHQVTSPEHMRSG